MKSPTLATLVRAHPDGVVVAGWGARSPASAVARFAAGAGWPVLADPVSNARTGSHAVSTYEALLRAERVRGVAPAEFGVARRRARDEQGRERVAGRCPAHRCRPRRRVAGSRPDGVGATRRAARIVRSPQSARPSENRNERVRGCEEWLAAEHTVRAAIDQALDANEHAIEGRIARDLMRALPDGSACVVASSLPVRALEWCMAPRPGVRVFANRGANGIDGFVSTARGIAEGRAPRAHGRVLRRSLLLARHERLAGRRLAEPHLRRRRQRRRWDLLVPSTARAARLRAPVRDAARPRPGCRRAWRTACTAERVTEPEDWPGLLDAGPQVIVVPVDRAASVAGHRRLWDAAASSLRAGDRVASLG